MTAPQGLDADAASHEPPVKPHPAGSEEFDQELNIKGILWATAGVIIATLLSALAVWAGFKGFAWFDRREAAQPGAAPPPMMQAASPMDASVARLQASPTDDMTAMHAQDELMVDHAGWADRAQGTVRLPIAMAIDVLAQRGLPKVTTPPLAEMAAHGSYEDEGRPPTDQPSPGSLLAPPGMGIGSIGPPSAGAGQQLGAAQPGPLPAEAGKASPPTPGTPPTPVNSAKPAPPPSPGLRVPTTPPPPPGGLP